MINFDIIFTNLLLGSCPRSPVDLERLRTSAKTTAVLNLQTDDDYGKWGIDWPALQDYYATGEVLLKRVPILDWDEHDLERRLQVAARALDDLICAQHRVYVHCTAGVGRAPATVIAWLAWYENYTLGQAVEHVMSRRDCQPYIEAIRRAGEQHKPPQDTSLETSE